MHRYYSKSPLAAPLSAAHLLSVSFTRTGKFKAQPLGSKGRKAFSPVAMRRADMACPAVYTACKQDR